MPLKITLAMMPGVKIIVATRKTTARPGINNLRHGKMSLITRAPTASATSSAGIHRQKLRAHVNDGS